VVGSFNNEDLSVGGCSANQKGEVLEPFGAGIISVLAVMFKSQFSANLIQQFR
jgi:hypothetical protein